MRLLIVLMLAGCTTAPAPQPFFTESTGMIDSQDRAIRKCYELVAEVGRVNPELGVPQDIFDWCMWQRGFIY